jgi:hypothetical protein
MARKKFDGVVEAVHYSPEGQVVWVRAYERRGPTFSDRVLIPRGDLISKIKSGKRYFVGQRVPFVSSTFEVNKSVQVVQKDGQDILATEGSGKSQDFLEGVPVI